MYFFWTNIGFHLHCTTLRPCYTYVVTTYTNLHLLWLDGWCTESESGNRNENCHTSKNECREKKKNRTKTCLETMCCLIAKWFWSIEFIAWKEHFRRKIQNITHQLRICFLIIFSTVFPSVSPFYFYWESLAEVLTKLIDF